MNSAFYIVLIIVFCIFLLLLLPQVFLKKNARDAYQQDYESYVKRLSVINKQYLPHQTQLMSNLNVINFWLQTGKDPNDEDTLEAERIEADRYRRKLMTPQEAKEFEEKRSKNIFEKADSIEYDTTAKAMRKNEFHVDNLEGCEVEQEEMDFYYSTEFGECLYYCVTKAALDKKYYKNVLYFTTSRPSKIPMVYPHKYDGAQMLSLYKHPAQAVWFLTNWKQIRETFEHSEEMKQVDLDTTIKDFDV